MVSDANNIKRRNRRQTPGGLTLVELLVALMVTSIILSAVATLAYAMTRANDQTSDTAQKQAQLRSATLRVSELVRYCRLICPSFGADVRIWRQDSNGDGKVNINELVFIERGAGADYLRLCQFPESAVSTVSLADVRTIDPSNFDVTYAVLIPQCSNVQFSFVGFPPNAKRLSILFDLAENNITRRCQITAGLRVWSGYLLDDSGEIVSGDDD